jgi:hypothetical protein
MAFRTSTLTLVPDVTAGAMVTPGIGDSLTFVRKHRLTMAAVSLESNFTSRIGLAPGVLLRCTTLSILTIPLPATIWH